MPACVDIAQLQVLVVCFLLPLRLDSGLLYLTLPQSQLILFQPDLFFFSQNEPHPRKKARQLSPPHPLSVPLCHAQPLSILCQLVLTP